MGLLDFLSAKERGKGARRRSAAALYAAAVAQARKPAFYTALGVPDTVDGRFDLIVLHVHLMCRRLGRGGAHQLAQALFDTMFRDMDRNLREMGVSDPSMHRRIKEMVGSYYGRRKAYDAALAEGGEALTAALARNIYAGAADASPAARLAQYVCGTVAALEATAPEELAAGRVAFAPVEA